MAAQVNYPSKPRSFVQTEQGQRSILLCRVKSIRVRWSIARGNGKRKEGQLFTGRR